MAVEARDMVMEPDAVTHGPPADPGTDFHNRPGSLMAIDALWCLGSEVDLLDVGGADTAGGHADEDLAGADAGHIDGLDAEVVHAAVDDRLHGLRNHAGRYGGRGIRDSSFKV